MKFIAIIPARYTSTRFPGKPLVDMRGKAMFMSKCRHVSIPFMWRPTIPVFMKR